MSTEIQEYAVTFGVQYGRRPDADQHPQGVHGDEYVIIEAPGEVTARKIVHAIFEDRWAFIYPVEEFLDHPMRDTWHPGGEALRIAWQTPDQKNALLEQMKSIVEGHPARDPLLETAQGERTEFAKGQDQYKADHEAALNAPKDSLGNLIGDSK